VKTTSNPDPFGRSLKNSFVEPKKNSHRISIPWAHMPVRQKGRTELQGWVTGQMDGGNGMFFEQRLREFCGLIALLCKERVSCVARAYGTNKRISSRRKGMTN